MSTLPTALGRLPRLADSQTRSRRALAGVLAVLPAAAIGLVRLSINAPIGPSVPAGVVDGLAVAGVLGPALAAGVLTLETDGAVRIGMAFAAAFGALSLFGAGARVPAAVALIGAVWLVAGSQAKAASGTDDRWGAVAAVALAAGVTVSLAAYLGVAPPVTRGAGSSLALLGIAASPVLVDWTRPAVLAGVVLALAWVGIALVAPFVAGAAALVVGGVLSASLGLQALGIAGGVTVAGTGIHRGAIDVTLAGVGLLAAGVPATVPRALVVIVAVALLVVRER